MKTRSDLYVVVACVLALGSLGGAVAQVNISGPRTLEMSPGETRTVEYVITNYGEAPAQASIFFNDYAQQSGGDLQHIPAQSLPQSLFGIADFEQTEFVLPAGASARAPLRIAVPEEALGSYWGVVGVETPPPPPAEGGNAVGFNVRYAMVTNLEISGAVRHELSVDNLAATTVEGEQALVVTIRNGGNGYQRFELSVSFEGVAGHSSTAEDKGVVLPGLTIDRTIGVPDDLPAGQYGVFAILTYQEGMRAEAVGTITVER